MATPATFTKAGTKATTAAKLDKVVFGVAPQSHELLKQAYDTYLANGRENLAIVKTRGLVRGGGKKPWKQKGTGRARFGSSRNPIWRGGGIVFGPTGEENYTKALNVKAKRLAIRQALSTAADAGKIKVIESIDFNAAKTTAIANLLAKIEAKGRVLVIVKNKDDNALRATNNLQNVQVSHADYVNVYDVLNADVVLFEADALAAVTERLKATATDKTDGGAK